MPFFFSKCSSQLSTLSEDVEEVEKRTGHGDLSTATLLWIPVLGWLHDDNHVRGSY